MRELIVIRHAKSSWDEPRLSDRERPLNKRGKRDAPFMASLLKGRGLTPDLIVSSPAVRARKTAGSIAKELGYPKDRIVYDEAIYLQGVNALQTLIGTLPDDFGRVYLVGHNPDSTDLVNLFTDAGIDSLPTCGIASIEFPVDSWCYVAPGAGRLMFVDYPKRHPPPTDVETAP